MLMFKLLSRSAASTPRADACLPGQPISTPNAMSRRDNIDFNFIDMPASFTEVEETPFDTKYMNDPYTTGYDMARNGVPWEKLPPGYAE